MNPYDLKLESNIDQVLEVSNTTQKPSKREENTKFDQVSSRKATTKATNDLESRAIRNMF